MEYVIYSTGKKRKANYVVCLQCENTFLKDMRRIAKSTNHFCNKECLSTYQSRESIKVDCYQCGKVVIRKQSQVKINKSGLYFCSNECKNIAVLYTSAIRPYQYGTSRKYNKTRKCINCNEPVNSDVKYCLICRQSNFKYKQYIENWKTGVVTGNTGVYEEQISPYIRRYMFEKYDSKCCKCGWSEMNSITNKIPLTINHIDGNHKNSVESNLELICPNCHSLTHNYGYLNRGNGRSGRKNI